MSISQISDSQIMEQYQNVSSALAKRLVGMQEADRINQAQNTVKNQNAENVPQAQNAQETKNVEFAEILSRVMMAGNIKETEPIDKIEIASDENSKLSLAASQSIIERLTFGRK